MTPVRQFNGSHVSQLFQTAHAEGVLSPACLQALTVVDLGAQIQAGLGISVDDVQASEVVLVTVMPDDSGSIQHAGHARTVCDGHNLCSTRSWPASRRTASSSTPATSMASCSTPSGRSRTSSACTQELRRRQGHAPLRPGRGAARHRARQGPGVHPQRRSARTVTLLITDGGDCHSRSSRARMSAALVNDLRRARTTSSRPWASTTAAPTSARSSGRWASRTSGSSPPARAPRTSARPSRSSASPPSASARARPASAAPRSAASGA